MKRFIPIAIIFILVVLLFATPYLVKAATHNADPASQGAADDTGSDIADLATSDTVYYQIKNGETMEIVTWTTTAGTINHARLHIQYWTDDGYDGFDYVQWQNGAGYANTTIQIDDTLGEAGIKHEYWEFPRSAIDTWAEIGVIDIKLYDGDTVSPGDDIQVDLLEIIVTYDATLESHNDSDRLTPEEDTFNDPAKPTVYMKGTGFEAGLQYKIAYYKGDGSQVEAEVDTATDGSLITSNCLITSYYTGVADETWHAVVFHPSTADAPGTYAGAIASELYVIEDSFTVTTAIPEFSTVMAAIAVAGLCCGIYFWMRRRHRRVEVRIQY